MESKLNLLIRQRNELIDPYFDDEGGLRELPEEIEEKENKLTREILAEMRLIDKNTPKEIES